MQDVGPIVTCQWRLLWLLAVPKALAAAAMVAAPSARASCHPVTSHSAKCLHSGHWEGLWVIFIECLAYASHTITPNADHVTFRLENGMWIEWLCHNMVNVPPCHRPCSPSFSGRAWRPWALAALPGVEGAAH